MLILNTDLLGALALAALAEGWRLNRTLMTVDRAKVVGSAIEEAGVFNLILFFYLHVHENLYAGLDIVDKSKAVDFSQLALLLLEQLFVVAINLFIRSDLHAEV